MFDWGRIFFFLSVKGGADGQICAGWRDDVSFTPHHVHIGSFVSIICLHSKDSVEIVTQRNLGGFWPFLSVMALVGWL